MAPCAGRYQHGPFPDFRSGVRRSQGHRRLGKGRQIVEIVPHESGFFQGNIQFVGGLLQDLSLKNHIFVHGADAQFHGPVQDDFTVAAGNESHLDAVAEGQADAHAVPGIEMLGQFPFLSDDDAAVRQDPVHIQGQETDLGHVVCWIP